MKKTLSLLLAVIMISMTFTALPITANAANESVWDGSSVDTGWYGDGSADTFEISTAEEFAGLIELTCYSSGSNFAGKTINLTNDINLDNKDWTPLGTAKRFAGVLDGNNHTIKNVVITTTEVPYHGLFMTTSGATIQNLTIENFRDSNSQISGAFVGFALSTTLKNCTAKNCNFNTTTYYCGGLVGNSSHYLKVCNSSFIDGSVNAGYYAGGIVGNQQSDEGSEFKHIMVDPGEGGHIKGTYYVGGVTGYTQRTKTSTASYEDCITYGVIISNGIVYGVGGILGFDDSKSINYKLSMKNCVSFADINVNLTSYNDRISVGGIIGSMQPVPDTVSSLYASLDYCDFFGTISTSGSGAIKSGGITGWVSYILQNCANFGEIKGDRVTWAGGITGASTRDRMNILNSYNAGTVNPHSGDSIGAFSGYHGYSNADQDIRLFMVSNAYNVGDIKREDTTVTEQIIGLQFWGTLDGVYWLHSGSDNIYASIDNTYQEASRLNNLGHFYGSDLDTTKSVSSLVYSVDIDRESRPFLAGEGSSKDKNLLTVLNDEAAVNDGYLHWVVYPDDDIADSVTAEDAIPEKVEAFAKVKDYKYPMLAHTSTVEYATEEDEIMGSPVIRSFAVDNDDTKVNDAAYRTVMVDPNPIEGCAVKSVTVKDGYDRDIEVRENADGTYSYTMPRTDATVTVAYESLIKPNYHINNADIIAAKYNDGKPETDDDIFTSYVEASTNKEVKFGDTIERFYTIPEVVPTSDNSCPYIFKGWYYDQNNEDDSHPVQFGTDRYTKDIYAHWIKVEDVAKDEEDESILPNGYNGKYGGFDLAGVNIRKEMRDYNFEDVLKTPGGLRFVTSLSMDVVNQINAIKPNNIEYGYVAAKYDGTSKSWIDYHKGHEKLQYVSTSANGINTTNTTEKDEDYFGFAHNVKCTSGVANRVNNEVRRDHQNYGDYLLYSFVVTYEGEDASSKDINVLARPYIHYTDANGSERVAYSEYLGISNTIGGCCTSYNSIVDMAGN